MHTSITMVQLLSAAADRGFAQADTSPAIHDGERRAPLGSASGRNSHDAANPCDWMSKAVLALE